MAPVNLMLSVSFWRYGLHWYWHCGILQGKPECTKAVWASSLHSTGIGYL